MTFKSICLLLLAAFLVSSCNKDKFTTKPQLTLKSISPNPLPNNSIIQFDIQFTDKEGDIGDSLFMNRISRVCPSNVVFNLSGPLPKFTTTSYQEGIFEIKYAYNLNGTGLPIITSCSNRNDTSIFRIWLKDKAGNSSDTLVTPPVVFLR
jgi:hypothetical protein